MSLRKLPTYWLESANVYVPCDRKNGMSDETIGTGTTRKHQEKEHYYISLAHLIIKSEEE
jgi:hypothetical protein